MASARSDSSLAMSARGPLGAWGRAMSKNPWKVIVVWLMVLLAAGAYGSGISNKLSMQGNYDETADSWGAYQLHQEHFPGQAADAMVVYSSETHTVDDPAFRTAVTDTLSALPQGLAQTVVNGLDMPSEAQMVSPDRRAVRVTVSLPTADVQNTLANYRTLAPLLVASDPHVRTDIGGIAAMGLDASDIASRDSVRAEMIALPIVFLLSLMIFGSLVAALLPSLVGAIGMTLSVAVLTAVTGFTEVSTLALMLVTLLGMGLAIDYTLFLVSRFREELGDGRGRAASQVAVAVAVATAGRTIVVSGVVVAISLVGMLVFPLAVLRSMAYGAIPAVLGAMLAAISLLPAVLVLLGHRVNAGRLPSFRRRQMTAPAQENMWGRIARTVMLRPWAWLLSVTAALVLAAAPFASATWGAPDEAMLPDGTPSKVAIAQEAKHFGGQETWAYSVVEGGTVAEVVAHAEALGKVPGVATSVVRGRNDVSGVSYIWLTWKGLPQSTDSQELVKALRAVPFSASRDNARAVVGGPTALTLDQVATVKAYLPWMVTFIVVSMLVVLAAAFRSIALPIKAVLTAALSIIASFGVITLIFQHGFGESLLGFTSVGYLDVMTPIVMGAILFGLSMDYEVFLLSRVKEDWESTGDNDHAVAAGLARTGRLITGAALLLAVVIGAFATSGFLVMKMMGIGMLVALLLDATVVRAILVPAAMKLLGRHNWWPGTRTTEPSSAQ